LKTTTLGAAVERFARATVDWPDAELERYWAWRAYDDGVRHAFFRTYEELRELATTVAAERVARGEPPTIAHRALAQHHQAYRDLEAVLLGFDDVTGNRQPTPDDWPLRQIVAHVMRTERQFFARIRYAVDRQRTDDRRPIRMSDDDFNAFFAGAPPSDQLLALPLSEVLAAYSELHRQVVAELADVRDEEQDAPSVWWEEEELPVRFRLHRFDSHLGQHIVHAEKTLADLALRPTEAKRLSRLLYNGLGELEGNLIGASNFADARCQLLAETIDGRLVEITPT
jgi:hypothetical protein